MIDLNHSQTLTARLCAAGLLLACAASAPATVRYVDVNNLNSSPPYTNWATAANIIQDAIDVAVDGDQILVTNGIYRSGGKAVVGTMTNRVAVNKPVTLRGVNGPQFTVIQGRQVLGTTNGDGAIRCVYLTSGASLSGFTLTNGATRSTGDEREQSGGGLWCEPMNAVVSNCVLAGNSAFSSGGGAYGGTLNQCTLAGNSAGEGGGGAYLWYGAGDTLNNCALTGNSALYSGGGAYGGTLNNCTLTGNSAQYGGGVSGGYHINRAHLNNCILYFNTAPQGPNYYSNIGSFSILNYCCTTPLPPDGIGNISSDPQLASASHISPTSPCRGAGDADYATGADIDGEAWAIAPSIGCDEFHAGAMTGELRVGLAAEFTNVATAHPVGFTALIEGPTTASVWDFADGLTATNQPYTTHAWTTAGDYAVVLRAYNESQPTGLRATVTVHVVAQPVHYVAANGANPVAPYTSWVTAATNIQDAVDAATLPGALVLVTNGTYTTGGREVMGTTDRVAVDKPVTVQSVSGPRHTAIDGGQQVRCVYLASGASLSGFTLTKGIADNGGGVSCESLQALVSNCVVVGNFALDGGGAYYGTLNN